MIGAGVNITKAKGHMIVDIGGGTTDVAIVSMNGVVTSYTIKTAGNAIDRSIMKYMQNKFKLLIGERTAEKVKIELCNLYDPSDEITYMVKGRSLMKGLPAQVLLSERELFEAIEDDTFAIMEAVRKVLEDAPPELVGDICANGVLLTGGGALLGGLEPYLTRMLGVPCRTAKDPLTCVARGTEKAFTRRDILLDGFERIDAYTQS
jgi:rod shape-determining protein MreB